MRKAGSKILLIGTFLAILPGATLLAQSEKTDEALRKDKKEETSIASSFSVTTGLGFNSNVFDTPTQGYTDYATTPPVAVTVHPRSGFFIPLRFSGEGMKPSGKNRFLFSYDGKSDRYLGETKNATSSRHLFKGAFELVKAQQGKREDTLHLEALLTRNQETYVDHDSGALKTTSKKGKDLSNRYNYTSTGFGAEYTQDTSSIQFGVRAEQESLDYAVAGDGTEYDHVYTLVGGDVTVPVSDALRANVDLKNYSRAYSSRHAWDLAGSTKKSYPLREYRYKDLKTELRYRTHSIWSLFLDYRRLERSDAYVGYGDYTLQRYRAWVVAAPSESYKARLEYSFWNREYPRGLAFDAPTCGASACERKRYDGMDVSLKNEFPRGKNLKYDLRLEYKEQNSTDPRYAFKRILVQGEVNYSF